ncbi:MAG: SH3 domain-containing protein, partial [Anaerolineales bacterium]
MKRYLWILLSIGFGCMLWLAPVWTPAAAQQPTGNVPTVTGTPGGPIITVTSPDGANVRAGPSSYDYPLIGALVPSETAPAIGRSPGQEWIQIIYLGAPGGVGWVYSSLVSLSPGFLPIVEPPPTATPRTTPTINPTYAAAFQVQTTPTRLPTFTPPPPLSTLHFDPAVASETGIPMGFVILG